MSLFQRSFRFIDHGPLVDRELELVLPQKRWVDDLLTACRHPTTAAEMPREARLTRQEILQFLQEAPLGRSAGDPALGRVPAYQFWMLLRHGPGGLGTPPPLRIAGGVSVRIGSTEAVELYYGHLGYHVMPAARGHGYARRACQLVLPLLRAHGFRSIWITCSPGNIASEKTIQRLGARYVDTVDVPQSDPLHARGETVKHRYVLEV